MNNLIRRHAPPVGVPKLFAVCVLMVGALAGCSGSMTPVQQRAAQSAASLAKHRVALTISGTPATSVAVGSVYSFTPTVSDSTGKQLHFSIQNAPLWATFASSGQLSGTPSSADVGTYPNIVISVMNGNTRAQLPAFSLSVMAATTATHTVTYNADGSTGGATPSDTNS